MTRKKNATKAKPPKTGGKPAPTSFVVRQITKEDQVLLDKVRRITGTGNDSRAITEMLRDYAPMAERVKEARGLYIALAQKVAAMMDAMDERDEAVRVIEQARKELKGTANLAYAASNRWQYDRGA